VQRLDEMVAMLSAVVPGLGEAVRRRFGDVIVTRKRALQRLAQRINADESQSGSWTDLREERERCASLAREYLAFAEGEFARQVRLDGGLLRVADALIAELGRRIKINWDPLTILAETEWYGEEAQIIRLRFPEVSIWNLPVAIHEFGHFAGPRLGVRKEVGRFWELHYPLQDILRREFTSGPVQWSRMHELFADAFTVFLTGPAYACVCMLIRFDPTAAGVDGPTHPSNVKRVHMMLRILEKMDQEVDSASYAGVLRQLRERWRASVAEASEADPQDISALEAQVANGLEATVDEMWQLLQDILSAQRYGGMTNAQRLKSTLYGRTLAQPEASVTLADVLNAAWLCRLDHWDDDRDVATKIGTQALKLCEAIADRDAVDR
jgi:hypothetical protein